MSREDYDSLEELRREWPGVMSEHVGAEFRRLEARLRAAEQELQELRTENKVLADALAQVGDNTP